MVMSVSCRLLFVVRVCKFLFRVWVCVRRLLFLVFI